MLRSTGIATVLAGILVGTIARPVVAAPPVVTIDATDYQTVTFTSPPIYDRSVKGKLMGRKFAEVY